METRDKIIQWAKDRGLNNPVKQTLKTLSEAGELADAVCSSNLERLSDNEIKFKTYIDNIDNIIDAIGDIEVCLTILKNQLGLGQDYCIESAYKVISERKGKTINGTFIKE